jgi:hypothetical protein
MWYVFIKWTDGVREKVQFKSKAEAGLYRNNAVLLMDNKIKINKSYISSVIFASWR